MIARGEYVFWRLSGNMRITSLSWSTATWPVPTADHDSSTPLSRISTCITIAPVTVP